MGVTKPYLLSFFVHQNKKSLKESTSFNKAYFMTTFGNKSMRKVCSESELETKSNVVPIVQFFLSLFDLHHFQAR